MSDEPDPSRAVMQLAQPITQRMLAERVQNT